VWSSKTGTLLSSTGFGTIFKVNDDGTTTSFATDSRLKSTIGLHIDDTRNELLVCNTGSFVRCDLDTGAIKAFVDLSNLRRPDYNGTIFPNDVVNDAQGNAYVTDSRGGVVWKIEPNTNTASIFVSDPSWITPGIGLNGIEIAGGGRYLLVGTSVGLVYKVSLPTPNIISVVSNPQNLTGLDGMIMRPNGDLVVVGNRVQKIYLVKSNDDWTSATVSITVQSNYPSPTTAALRDGNVYVSHAYFGVANRTTFEIEKIQDLYVAPASSGSSNAGWVILLVILCLLFAIGVGGGIFIYIRKRQQRYRQFKSDDLATTEFDDEKKDEKDNEDW
jgi:hypothetical protein